MQQTQTGDVQDGAHVYRLQTGRDGGEGAGHQEGGGGTQVVQTGGQLTGHHQGDVHWLVLEAQRQDGRQQQLAHRVCHHRGLLTSSHFIL